MPSPTPPRARRGATSSWLATAALAGLAPSRRTGRSIASRAPTQPTGAWAGGGARGPRQQLLRVFGICQSVLTRFIFFFALPPPLPPPPFPILTTARSSVLTQHNGKRNRVPALPGQHDGGGGRQPERLPVPRGLLQRRASVGPSVQAVSPRCLLSWYAVGLGVGWEGGRDRSGKQRTGWCWKCEAALCLMMQLQQHLSVKKKPLV